jgi:hypothetical protein
MRRLTERDEQRFLGKSRQVARSRARGRLLAVDGRSP